MIDHSRLLTLLNYNPKTGQFTWLIRPRKNTSVGAIAGCLKLNGYIRITIDGRPYQAHRLAWFYVHGQWPRNHIDHVNGDRSDNRIANLRDATRTENLANSSRPSHNTSGYKGVSWCALMGKWLAQIQASGKNTSLGYFDNPNEAHEAYMKAARQKFGDFARSA